MYDEICGILRDVIKRAIVQEALTEDTELAAVNTSGLNATYTDTGLAVDIDGVVYGINVEKF